MDGEIEHTGSDSEDSWVVLDDTTTTTDECGDVGSAVDSADDLDSSSPLHSSGDTVVSSPLHSSGDSVVSVRSSHGALMTHSTATCSSTNAGTDDSSEMVERPDVVMGTDVEVLHQTVEDEYYEDEPAEVLSSLQVDNDEIIESVEHGAIADGRTPYTTEAISSSTAGTSSSDTALRCRSAGRQLQSSDGWHDDDVITTSVVRPELQQSPSDIAAVPHHHVHEHNDEFNPLFTVLLVLCCTCVLALGTGHFIGWLHHQERTEDIIHSTDTKLDHPRDDLVSSQVTEDNQDPDSKWIKVLLEENKMLMNRLKMDGISSDDNTGAPSTDGDRSGLRNLVNQLRLENDDLRTTIARLRYGTASQDEHRRRRQLDEINQLVTENGEMRRELVRARYLSAAATPASGHGSPASGHGSPASGHGSPASGHGSRQHRARCQDDNEPSHVEMVIPEKPPCTPTVEDGAVEERRLRSADEVGLAGQWKEQHSAGEGGSGGQGTDPVVTASSVPRQSVISAVPVEERPEYADDMTYWLNDGGQDPTTSGADYDDEGVTEAVTEDDAVGEILSEWEVPITSGHASTEEAEQDRVKLLEQKVTDWWKSLVALTQSETVQKYVEIPQGALKSLETSIARGYRSVKAFNADVIKSISDNSGDVEKATNTLRDGIKRNLEKLFGLEERWQEAYQTESANDGSAVVDDQDMSDTETDPLPEEFPRGGEEAGDWIAEGAVEEIRRSVEGQLSRFERMVTDLWKEAVDFSRAEPVCRYVKLAQRQLDRMEAAITEGYARLKRYGADRVRLATFSGDAVVAAGQLTDILSRKVDKLSARLRQRWSQTRQRWASKVLQKLPTSQELDEPEDDDDDATPEDHQKYDVLNATGDPALLVADFYDKRASLRQRQRQQGRDISGWMLRRARDREVARQRGDPRNTEQGPSWQSERAEGRCRQRDRAAEEFRAGNGAAEEDHTDSGRDQRQRHVKGDTGNTDTADSGQQQRRNNIEKKADSYRWRGSARVEKDIPGNEESWQTTSDSNNGEHSTEHRWRASGHHERFSDGPDGGQKWTWSKSYGYDDDDNDVDDDDDDDDGRESVVGGGWLSEGLAVIQDSLRRQMENTARRIHARTHQMYAKDSQTFQQQRHPFEHRQQTNDQGQQQEYFSEQQKHKEQHIKPDNERKHFQSHQQNQYEKQQKHFQDQQQKHFQDQQHKHFQDQQKEHFQSQQKEHFQDHQQKHFHDQQQKHFQDQQEKHFQDHQQKHFHDQQKKHFQDQQQKHFHNQQQKHFQDQQKKHFPDQQQKHFQDQQQKHFQDQQQKYFQDQQEKHFHEHQQKHFQDHRQKHSQDHQQKHFQDQQKEHFQSQQKEHFKSQQQKHFQDHQQKHFHDQQQKHFQDQQEKHFQDHQQKHFQDQQKKHFPDQQQKHFYNQQQKHFQDQQKKHFPDQQQKHFQDQQQKHFQDQQQKYFQDQQEKHFHEHQQKHFQDHRQKHSQDHQQKHFQDQQKKHFQDQQKKHFQDQQKHFQNHQQKRFQKYQKGGTQNINSA